MKKFPLTFTSIPFQILSKLCASDSTKNFNGKSCAISTSKSFKESQDPTSDLLAERKLAEVVKDVCSIHDDLCDTCYIAVRSAPYSAVNTMNDNIKISFSRKNTFH